jgi:hypothetical protein
MLTESRAKEDLEIRSGLSFLIEVRHKSIRDLAPNTDINLCLALNILISLPPFLTVNHPHPAMSSSVPRENQGVSVTLAMRELNALILSAVDTRR